LYLAHGFEMHNRKLMRLKSNEIANDNQTRTFKTLLSRFV
jgi:hypothetical protein